MKPVISPTDEGTPLVTVDGTPLGRVTRVHRQIASVDLRPDVSESVASFLGRADSTAELFPLQRRSIAAIMDDEVRVRRRPTAGDRSLATGD
jgi:hypothetical protein